MPIFVCFAASIAELAHFRKIAYSLTELDVSGTEAFTSEYNVLTCFDLSVSDSMDLSTTLCCLRFV